MALAGASQLVVISPAGEELARIPDPVTGPRTDPPFDAPASVAFSGERVLVTNQSFPAGNPDHWAVFDIFTGEPGQPLFRPHVRAAGRRARPRLALRLTYNRGPRRCAVGRVRAAIRGADRELIRRVVFRLDGRRVAVDRRDRFRAIVLRARSGAARRHRVSARVSLAARRLTLTRRVRTCGRR